MPKKELKSFAKVYLKPGQEQTVTLTIKREDLKIYDPERGLLILVGSEVPGFG